MSPLETATTNQSPATEILYVPSTQKQVDAKQLQNAQLRARVEKAQQAMWEFLDQSGDRDPLIAFQAAYRLALMKCTGCKQPY